MAIRVPCNGVISDSKQADTDYSELNKYQIKQQGSKITIVALGDFFRLGEKTAKAIAEKTCITPTLINPRYITGLDKKLLTELKENHKLVITLEDGILNGGFGEKIARFYDISDIKLLNYSFKKEFPDRYRVEAILCQNRLTSEQITEDAEIILCH